MAKRAGMNYNIQPTPAVALGAYEITPIEAAGAYTLFANEGIYVKPSFIAMVRSMDGKIVYRNQVEQHQVLDPRVAYLMTNLMEDVLRYGTAAGVRGRYGFNAPAAGKTGTSHDGWFAGFTSDLLCIVWVGFDDNRELDIEGARSALPIWTEFMKRAITYRQYSNAKPFDAPDGIVTINVDPQTGMAATSACPERKPEVFIAGTEPVGFCPLHGGKGDQAIVSGWDVPSAETAEQKPGVDTGTPRPPTTPSQISQNNLPLPVPYRAQGTPEPVTPPKKKGFVGRLKDVFK